MRLADLTEEQKKLRALIVDRLAAAGWEPTAATTMADQGADTPFVAGMMYERDTVVLQAEYDANNESLRLWIEDLLGAGIRLIIHFEDRLEDLLGTIVSFQDRVDMENYRESVSAILKICPKTYKESDDESETTSLVVEDGEA